MHLNKAQRNARQGMSLLTLPKTSGSSKRRNQGCYGNNASATIGAVSRS